jgi:ribosome-binding protein aMBF1 (putative translation factor)
MSAFIVVMAEDRFRVTLRADDIESLWENELQGCTIRFRSQAEKQDQVTVMNSIEEVLQAIAEATGFKIVQAERIHRPEPPLNLEPEDQVVYPPVVAVPLLEQLQQAVESSGMTRYAISQRSGVNQSILCRLVKGQRVPTAETSERIANLLGYTVGLIPVKKGGGT